MMKLVMEQQLQLFLLKRSIAKVLKIVTAGHNPTAVKRGIDQAVATVVEELLKLG